MNDREIFITMINANLSEMNETINCLYITTNICVKNKLLNHLRRNMFNIFLLVQGLKNGASMNSLQPITERLFTPEELSRYNGRDGNPAYVAVNELCMM